MYVDNAKVPLISCLPSQPDVSEKWSYSISLHAILCFCQFLNLSHLNNSLVSTQINTFHHHHDIFQKVNFETFISKQQRLSTTTNLIFTAPSHVFPQMQNWKKSSENHKMVTGSKNLVGSNRSCSKDQSFKK